MRQREAATQILCEAIKACGTHKDSCPVEGQSIGKVLASLVSTVLPIALQPDPLFGYEGEAAILMIIRHITQSPGHLDSVIHDMIDEQKRVSLEVFHRIMRSYPSHFPNAPNA